VADVSRDLFETLGTLPRPSEASPEAGAPAP
jgi:hypothetical protein